MNNDVNQLNGGSSKIQSEQKDISESILGLSTNELAGLSIDEITNNPTAIKMIMHYYKKLLDENATLRNDNNTYKTYIDAYNRIKSNTIIGTLLLSLSNISVGFGVNLLTSSNIWPGLFTLIPGVLLIIIGIYINYFKER